MGEEKTKMDVKNELKNFAEDNKAEMSVNVYNGIWNIVQSVEEGHVIKDGKFNIRLCNLMGNAKRNYDFAMKKKDIKKSSFYSGEIYAYKNIKVMITHKSGYITVRKKK